MWDIFLTNESCEKARLAMSIATPGQGVLGSIKMVVKFEPEEQASRMHPSLVCASGPNSEFLH